MARTEINAIDLEVFEAGQGRTLLFLHAEDYFQQSLPWLERMAQNWRVVAPRHPGFGSSQLPADVRKVDDLAYLYLDWLEREAAADVLLVGASFGAWIALEMCVRQPRCAARLALIGPIGVKFSGREERDFLDIYADADDTVTAATFADPQRWRPDYAAMQPAQVEAAARDRQTAATFMWTPYMHNPVLNKWLHRVTAPTLVLRGAQDGLVRAANTEALARALPNATLQTVEVAGHYPQIEQAEAVARAIDGFAGR